jgi:adenosylhomocysteine nucleosidase
MPLRPLPDDEPMILNSVVVRGRLDTVGHRVADEPEKRRLATTYKASLVDMEAAAIARLAAMRSIPFYAIKGISDPLDAKLPDFNRFIDPNGQFQTPKFVLFALLRPWIWPSLVKMGENSRKASQSIAERLHELLNE